MVSLLPYHFVVLLQVVQEDLVQVWDFGVFVLQLAVVPQAQVVPEELFEDILERLLGNVYLLARLHCDPAQAQLELEKQ